MAREEDGVDDQVFGGLVELGREVVADLVMTYRDDSARLAAALAAGCDARDAAACARAAHDLKSTSAALGAVDVERIAAELERAARNGEVARLSSLVDTLGPALARARAALQARSDTLVV